jgi:hypothetical protein
MTAKGSRTSPRRTAAMRAPAISWLITVCEVAH